MKGKRTTRATFERWWKMMLGNESVYFQQTVMTNADDLWAAWKRADANGYARGRRSARETPGEPK